MSGVGDEARFELALAASGRERANRPRALVVGAVLALVLALLAAVWGLSSRRAARASLRAAQAEQVQVDEMLKEWDTLERLEREGGPGGAAGIGKPIDGLYSKMEQLATRAGIKDKPQPPRPIENNRPPLKIIEYNYTNVKDASLKALLEWPRLASAEIPGMEVYGLTLKPDPINWTLNVTFRRWERAQ